MSSTLLLVTQQWTDIFSYALIDYLYETVLEGPMVRMGNAGRSIGNGLNFAVKIAASQTHPLNQVGGMIRLG